MTQRNTTDDASRKFNSSHEAIIHQQNPSIPNIRCSKDEDCTVGEAVRAGNGIKTGLCLETNNGTCEVYGWCPIETHMDPDPTTIVRQAENFTLYIRNVIRFSRFGFTTSNVPKENRSSLLKNCLYDETFYPYCPIFRLGDIVNKTGHSFEKIALNGGSIGILVEWSCDLDKDSDCRPNYNFIYLGNLTKKIGFNFRFARYSIDAAGQKRRTLYKVFGIHLDIMVCGSARKFCIIPTIINIASALTLMAASSYLCDIMLLYMKKKRNVHTFTQEELKLERVTTNDRAPEGLKRKFSL
ncbi:purinergic receptor P2X, ligand-gated ion channel, 8 [Garra rufa]|uniref:purinergic receptor P2X, ligand-gated ion channel, 8 n=1 Tax=Garra rufa TaxID=137080 RepID=UPI003CCE7F88